MPDYEAAQRVAAALLASGMASTERRKFSALLKMLRAGLT
jgi:hypothetical protein